MPGMTAQNLPASRESRSLEATIYYPVMGALLSTISGVACQQNWLGLSLTPLEGIGFTAIITAIQFIADNILIRVMPEQLLRSSFYDFSRIVIIVLSYPVALSLLALLDICGAPVGGLSEMATLGLIQFLIMTGAIAATAVTFFCARRH